MKTEHGQRSSFMKLFVIGTIVARSMLLVGHGVADAATPAPAGSRSATDTIADLEAKGHHVQINGTTNVPLSLCKATGVHGLNDSNLDSSGSRIDEDQFTTIYVDVVCQNP
jgi:hypothetical protein